MSGSRQGEAPNRTSHVDVSEKETPDSPATRAVAACHEGATSIAQAKLKPGICSSQCRRSALARQVKEPENENGWNKPAMAEVGGRRGADSRVLQRCRTKALAPCGPVRQRARGGGPRTRGQHPPRRAAPYGTQGSAFRAQPIGSRRSSKRSQPPGHGTRAIQ